jgi:MHS family shikimate/dehydroshikimate transporter-like MFS transporter
MTTTADASSTTERPSLRRVACATAIGAFLEWYDFNLFGVASALVFGKLFFPSFSPVAGTLLSFATFGAAWLARPIGGLIFGHFGDRLGRKRILLITLLMMGLSTTLIGILPTYATIGVWAPVLLLVIRIIQGISAGGEWSGAATMATEHAPSGRKGLYGSFPQLGTPLALVAANGMILLSSKVASDDLLTYAWRFPFLLSILVIPIGIWIRRGIPESPDFELVRSNQAVAQAPAIKVVKEHWRTILLVILMVGGINTYFFTFTTYVLTYSTAEVGFPRTTALIAVMIAAVVMVPATIAFGRLSDRVSRRKLYICGFLSLAVTVVPLFLLMNTGSPVAFVLGLSVGVGVCFACVWSLASTYLTELFPTGVRFSGSAIGYQFSGTLFAAPMPLLGATLVAAAGGRPWYVAILLIVVALVAAWAAFVSRPDAVESTEPAPAVSKAIVAR